jgi:hypothetical protein
LEDDRRAAYRRANALDQILAENLGDDRSGAPDPKKRARGSAKLMSKKPKRKKS